MRLVQLLFVRDHVPEKVGLRRFGLLRSRLIEPFVRDHVPEKVGLRPLSENPFRNFTVLSETMFQKK